jgi:hypothetical protein
VWIKARNAVANHVAFDIIRGANKAIYPSLTNAEDTYTATLTSFNSSGFTLGYDDWSGVNQSGRTYVGWAWDAGTTTVSNTQGSITGGSQVRANPSSGFSIINWTVGTANNVTVGHGLNVAPSFIITKNRNNTFGWACYHSGIANAQNGYIDLQTTGAFTTTSSAWNNTSPTSSVFTVGTASWWGSSTNSMIAYAFAPVSGYSSMSSFVGNGSSDGPFVYTGFRPRWVMVKRSSAAGSGGNWIIKDALRDGYNDNLRNLYANLSAAEESFYSFDILSNGFKIRSTDVDINQSGGTYIYAAFAESPFQYARAR